jgi:hypothetical protein
VTAQNGGTRNQTALRYRLVRQECRACDEKSDFVGRAAAFGCRYRTFSFANFAIALVASEGFPYRQ